MSLHSPGHRYRKMPERAQSKKERHMGIFRQSPQVSQNSHPQVTAVKKVKEIRDAIQSRLIPSYRHTQAKFRAWRRSHRQRGPTLFLEMGERAFLRISKLGV